MLKEPISRRYQADGHENFALTLIQKGARDRIAEKLENGEYLVEAVNCPLCGSQQSKLLSKKDTYGLPMKTVVCAECGIVYTNPRLAQESLPAFYGVDYRELDRALPGVDAYFQLERTKGSGIHRMLKENGLLERVRGKLVIEIGCGAGGVLAYFKNDGFDVLGCDLVPKHLEYGVNHHGMDLHYGNLELIRKIVTERGSEIGLIIYEQVFEHLPYPKQELEMLHGLMPAVSILYIGVPGIRNIDAQYNSDFLRFLQLPHLIHFDLDRLTAMMGASGFALLAGNEIVQAVYEPVVEKREVLKQGYQETVSFFAELEKRRKKKAMGLWIRQFPETVKIFTKRQIEISGLPRPVKNGLISFLKKIKGLKIRNW